MKVISLFSGIGGIDLGFLQEGFEIVWANDSSHEACITYRHNLGEQFIKEDDIRNVDVSQIPSADILIAGFPCQPFSVMGYQRGFNDPRGNLFFEIARIIESKKPKIVFLENLKKLNLTFCCYYAIKKILSLLLNILFNNTNFFLFS